MIVCPLCHTRNQGADSPIKLIGNRSLLCSNCGAIAVCPDTKLKQFYWGKTWESVNRMLMEDGHNPGKT